jgi:hypothetical protein
MPPEGERRRSTPRKRKEPVEGDRAPKVRVREEEDARTGHWRQWMDEYEDTDEGHLEAEEAPEGGGEGQAAEEAPEGGGEGQKAEVAPEGGGEGQKAEEDGDSDSEKEKT